MRLFCRQLANELLKLFARKRTYLGFAGSLVAEALFLLLWRHPLAQRAFEKAFQRGSAGPNPFFDDYFHGLTIALLMVAFTFLLLGGLYLALVAGDIVAKEVEDGTINMLLARPVSRLRLWSVKWLTCSIYTFALVFFMGLTSLLLASALCGGLGKLAVVYGQHPSNLTLMSIFDTAEGLWRYGQGLLLLAIVMHVVSALAFTFSCLNMKPATAAIATLAIFFVDAVLKVVPFFAVFEKWLLSYHLACWLRSFSKYSPAVNVTTSVVYLLALSVIFLSVSASQFCRRDFKTCQ
ncbi:MAG: ABC transporter permease [Verrucomicrobiota bacterium]|jgi:ABC-2 type transport system permease protein